MHRGKPTVLGAATGAVAGLVVITPACAFVTPMGAIGVGIGGAFVCYAALSGNMTNLFSDSKGTFELLAEEVYGLNTLNLENSGYAPTIKNSLPVLDLEITFSEPPEIEVLMGGLATVRLIHHITMWGFLIFIPVHVYMVVWSAIRFKHGGLDVMFTGYDYHLIKDKKKKNK